MAPAKSKKPPNAPESGEFIKTGIKGLDDFLGVGIPIGSSVLVAGGAGSGKTTLCLNILSNLAQKGKKCLYMSFEESEERLRKHMRDFNWKPEELERSGNLFIQRADLFDISRTIEGMLSKAKGDIRIAINPLLFPKNFNPDIIVIDSLTAIASTFGGKEQNYRIFIEQLFKFFEKINSTSFLITETKEVPEVFSPTGVEEFLADGVIVLYNFKRGFSRQQAIEILKLRGVDHSKKTVAMKIVNGSGVEIFPNIELGKEER